jgi:Vacuolar protein sorting-associated protein 53 C-terminus
MLDFTAIKAMLMDLPNCGIVAAEAPDSDSDEEENKPSKREEERTVVSGRYARHVSRGMGRADLVLKAVLTPADSLVDTYKGLVPDGSDEEFLKIMELKGLSRQEQRALMAQYSSGMTSMSGGPEEDASDIAASVAESSRKLGNKFLAAFSSKPSDA